jgi:hypothetical protein
VTSPGAGVSRVSRGWRIHPGAAHGEDTRTRRLGKRHEVQDLNRNQLGEVPLVPTSANRVRQPVPRRGCASRRALSAVDAIARDMGAFVSAV